MKAYSKDRMEVPALVGGSAAKSTPKSSHGPRTSKPSYQKLKLNNSLLGCVSGAVCRCVFQCLLR
jgi:hypothetical protein